MAKYSSTVTYNIKTTLDATGITKLQNAIDKTQVELKKMNALELIKDSEYKEAMSKLNNLQKAMQRSFNSNLGMLNLKTFRSELSKSGTSIADIGNSFKKAGHVGEQSFNQFLGRVGKIDTGLQNVNKTADKVFNTIGNTVRWGIIASGFQTILNNAHKAVTYMRDLDKSLTNIRMVTNYSKKDMREFAEYANKAAQALGSTTTKYTDAALIFAQQGFDMKSSSALGEQSIKLANVTGQSTETTSDQITSYMNAYNMDMQDIGMALDKWAEVANVSAANVEELSVATQKAGSTASTVGVNMDQLAAQIATIESVTRDAPENIGNGLKTIYARFSDLSLGKTLDDGMELGKVSGTLEGMGVEIINKETGVMNDVGVIMEDLMGVWDTLDQGQKAAAAQTLAGKYQMNRLMALMENSDMYSSFKTSSETASGTLDTMNEEYLESVEGRLQTLYASAQGLVSELFNQDSIGPFLEGLSEALNMMTKFTETIGGSQNLLLGLGATATKVFNNQIGRSINDTIGNIKSAKTKRDNLSEAKNVLTGMGLDKQGQAGSVLSYAQHGQKYGKYMSEDQQTTYNKNLEETVRLKNKEIDLKHQKDASILATNAAYRLAGADQDVISKNKDGSLNTNVLQSMPKLEAAQVEQVAKSLDVIDDKAVAATQGIVKLSSVLDKTEIDSTELSKSLDNARQKIEAIGKGTGVSSSTLQKYSKQLEIIEDEATSATPDLEKMRAATEKLNQELNEFRQLSRTAKDNPKGTIITSAKGADALVAAEAKAAAESAAQAQRNTADQTAMINQRAISSTINFAGSLGQLAFAWQSFQSLGSLWKRDDIEVGEKVLTTVMNVGMALPMLIGSIQATVEMTSAVKAATLGAVAAKQTESIELLKNIAATKANSAAKARHVNAVRGSTIAYGQENALLAVNTTTQKTNVITTKLATLATKGFAGALGSLLLPIAGVVAAVGALVVAAKGVYDWYNKDAQAAEEAKENANELRTVYEDLGNNLEEFNSGLSAYQEAKDALSGLKKGTKEWADALAKANNALIDIITKYPELAKYITRTKDGVLTISEEGIEAFVQQQEEGLLNAQIGSVTGAIAAGDAELTAEGTSLHRKIGSGFGQDELDILTQAYADGKNITSESVLAELLPHLPTDAIEEIASRSGEIAKYCEQINAQEESAQAQQEALVESILSQDQAWVDNDKIDKEQTVSDIVDYAESLMPEKITEYHTLSNDDLESQYIESTYGANSGYTAEINGEDLKVLDEKGEEVVTLSKDAAINSMASAEALKEAAEMWKEIARMFKNVGSEETNAGAVSGNVKEVLKTSSSGGKDFDFSSMSTAEKEKVKESGTGEGGKLTSKDLGITEDVAKTRGYEDAQAYTDAFNEGLNESIQQDLKHDQKYTKQGKADARNKDGKTNSEVSADLAGSAETSKDLQNSGAGGYEYTKSSPSEVAAEKEKISDSNLSEQQREAASKNVAAMEAANAAAEQYGESLGNIASKYPEISSSAENFAKARTEEKSATEAVTSAQKELDTAKEEEAQVQKEAAKELATAENMKKTSIKGSAKYADALEIERKANEKIAKAADKTKEKQDELDKANKKLTNSTKKTAKEQRILEKDIVRGEWNEAKKNCESYIKTLNSAEKGSKKYNQAAEQVASVLSDVSDVEVSADWVKKHGDLIDDWAEGGEGAASRLRVAIGIASGDLATELDTTKFKALEVQDVVNAMNGLSFDVTGRADFGQVFEAFGMVGENFKMNKEQAAEFAQAMSLMGVTHLELKGKNKGQFESINMEDLVSEDDKVRQAAIDALIKGVQGGWSVEGVVPDNGLRKVKTVNSDTGNSNASGGGGSGKGSKGSKKSPAKKDKKEHEYDRYKRINRQLEKITANYEKLANESDRLFGSEWRENLEAQNRELDKQIEKLKRKKELQIDEKNDAKSKLSSFGVRFDQYGAMTNFNQVRQGLIDDYNRVRNSGNEKAIERAEKALEEFDKWIDRYESALSGIEDTSAEIESATDQVEDNTIAILKAFTESAQAIEELNEAIDDFEGKINAFSAGDMDDPFANMQQSADKLLDFFDRKFVNTLGGMMEGTYIWGPNMDYDSVDGRGHGRVSTAAAYAQEVLTQRRLQEQGKKNTFGKNSAEALAAMEEAINALIEELDAAIEAWNDLNEYVLAMNEKIGEQIDERQEKYQAINDTLEYQKELTQLLYGEKAYDILDQIYDAQNRNSLAQLKEKQIELDMLKTRLADLEAVGDTTSDLYKSTQQQITETTREIEDATLSIIQTMQEAYEKAVDKMLDAWTANALGTDMEWMETQWELIERNSEQYLDNVNAAYETQKLHNKYLEMLDGETNLHNQQLITQQMNEQLGYLREKDKLSEYDVAYANAQLEILQKRIALEEAQNNKTQMKLKRDSQGNYSYVYTANEANTKAAENDLLEAENNAYNLSKDNMVEQQGNAMSALSDAYSTIQNIWTNANLTMEEKEKRTEIILDSLREYIAGTAEQLSTSEQNLINDFFGMVDNMTAENSERLGTAFDELVNGNHEALSLIDERFDTSIITWLEDTELFSKDCGKLLAGLLESAEDFQDGIDGVANTVRQDFDDITDSVQQCANATDDLTASSNDFFNTIAEQTNQMQGYNQALLRTKQEIVNMRNEYNATIEALNQEIDDLREENLRLSGNGGNPNGNPGGNPSGSSSGNPSGNPVNTSGDITGKAFGYRGMYYHDSWGMNPAGSLFAGQKGKVVVSDFSSEDVGGTTKKTGQYKVHIETEAGGHLGWIKKSQLFDTGGYTGTWTDGDPTAKNGKLAYLHQKELVLNENDTKNLLAAVETVRTLTNNLKTSTLVQSAQTLTSGFSTKGSDTIEQRVAIEANFPNVKDASEIEEALLSLSDNAYQWAHRYR